MFKKAMSLLLCASMVFSMAACSSAPASSAAASTSGSATGESSDDDQVTLRFAWWGGDSRHELTLQAVDLFMQKYPNIKVECDYGSWDG